MRAKSLLKGMRFVPEAEENTANSYLIDSDPIVIDGKVTFESTDGADQIWSWELDPDDVVIRLNFTGKPLKFKPGDIVYKQQYQCPTGVSKFTIVSYDGMRKYILSSLEKTIKELMDVYTVHDGYNERVEWGCDLFLTYEEAFNAK